MKHLPRLASSVLTLVLLASPALADDASDVAALKAQVTKLSKEVDALQANQKAAATSKKSATAQAAPAAAAPAATPMITAGSFPGSLQIPGTNTSIKLGGYIKLDAEETLGEGYNNPFAKFSAIPLKTDPRTQQGAQTNFTAQQSRLNLETRTATPLGELKTYIEGDFYGSPASNGNLSGYGFELRHAYGQLGPILAGQTWSNFMDTDAASESLDYVGSAGRVFVRQAQIRYTRDVGPVKASMSLEAPLTNDSFSTQTGVIVNTPSGTAASPRGSVPDLTLRGDYHYASDGYVSLRGLISEVNVDHFPTASSTDTSSRLGYAFGVSGKQSTVGKDNLRYDFNAGRGTGRYFYDIGASSNYANSVTGGYEAQDFVATTAGYQHYWTDQFRSNLLGGFVRNVNNVAYSGTGANKYIASGHANLIWQPVPAYSVGIEYMRGYRKVESGVEGSLNRIQTSFIFNF